VENAEDLLPARIKLGDLGFKPRYPTLGHVGITLLTRRSASGSEKPQSNYIEPTLGSHAQNLPLFFPWAVGRRVDPCIAEDARSSAASCGRHGREARPETCQAVIRTSFATTRLRPEFGPDSTGAALGLPSPVVTEIYVELVLEPKRRRRWKRSDISPLVDDRPAQPVVPISATRQVHRKRWLKD
jgi:hypothetical protein